MKIIIQEDSDDASVLTTKQILFVNVGSKQSKFLNFALLRTTILILFHPIKCNSIQFSSIHFSHQKPPHLKVLKQ